VRDRLPDGAFAATLSGSGPTVIVWARRERATTCAAELTERFPETDVLHLSISPTGAGQL
jgi:homoserine kinase